MNLWKITDGSTEWEIEVDTITVLKDSNLIWYKLIRLIDDYFTNKQSNVKIVEGEQIIQKKDWECHFIPFDAHLQVDKLKVKSPLNPLMDELCEDIVASPAYQELLSVWSELNEELQFANRKLDKYKLSLQLEAFDSKKMKQSLFFQPLEPFMSPNDYKLLFLKLLSERAMNKKTLIIIELPELYADVGAINQFMEHISQLSKIGYRFIIVTQKNLGQTSNYLFENQIIHKASLKMMKRKVQSQLPFVCEEDLYEEVEDQILELVDNCNFKSEILPTLSEMEQAKKVVLYTVFNHLDIPLNLDVTGFTPNLRSYIESQV